MKSQTKALVASVVVLALALSSISGATYSWFSDTQTANINTIVTGLDVGVVVTIAAANENYSKSSNIEISEIESEGGIVSTLTIGKQTSGDATKGPFKITATVTNNSGISIVATAKVVHTKELAIVTDGSGTVVKAMNVLFATKASGKDYSKATVVDWYHPFTDMKFGGGDGVNMSPGTAYNYKQGGTATDALGNDTDYDRIQYQDYSYSAGSVTVGPTSSKPITIDMNLGDMFDWNVINDLRVVVEIGQCSLYSFPIGTGDGKGSAVITQEIKSAKTPIMFIAKDLMVTVSGTTIADLSKVDIEYTHSGDIRTVVLRYYTLNPSYDPEAEDPGEEYIEKTEGIGGSVTLSYGSGDLFGSLTSPASKGTYTFVNGGTS